MSKENGASVITVIVGLAIFTITFYLLVSNSFASKDLQVANLQNAIADKFVVELIEFFRSLRTQDLTTYLVNTLPNYALCAHINILDRASNSIWNPDPMANLPLSRLDVGTPSPNSNRYYQVQVVDSITLNPNMAKCNCLPASAACTLTATETYMVTVRVKWLTVPSLTEKVLGTSTVLMTSNE